MSDARVDWLRKRARELGFDALGIGPVALPDQAERLDDWLERGHAGQMQWLTRNREVRLDLRERFPWAKSTAIVLQRYAARRGRDGIAPWVSAYAQHDDYHDRMLPPLERLGDEFAARHHESPRWHAYVDTGPVMERQLAAAAGLGWLGDNTLLLSREHGSWFFLGVLILEAELPVAEAGGGSCGECRACQPACPTGALIAPGVLDARRCISYLTIEHRGAIDEELRPAMGAWLFGCDLCQTACPVNHRARRDESAQRSVDSVLEKMELEQILELDAEEFRERFRRTPIWRARREGLVRNALIVAANLDRVDLLPAIRARLTDESEVVRECAAWALGRLEN